MDTKSRNLKKLNSKKNLYQNVLCVHLSKIQYESELLKPSSKLAVLSPIIVESYKRTPYEWNVLNSELLLYFEGTILFIVL